MFPYFCYNILGSQWKTEKQCVYMHVWAFQMNSYFVVLEKVVQMHDIAFFKSANSGDVHDVLINHGWEFQTLKDLRSMCWVHLGYSTWLRLHPGVSVLYLIPKYTYQRPVSSCSFIPFLTYFLSPDHLSCQGSGDNDRRWDPNQSQKTREYL